MEFKTTRSINSAGARGSAGAAEAALIDQAVRELRLSGEQLQRFAKLQESLAEEPRLPNSAYSSSAAASPDIGKEASKLDDLRRMLTRQAEDLCKKFKDDAPDLSLRSGVARNNLSQVVDQFGRTVQQIPTLRALVNEIKKLDQALENSARDFKAAAARELGVADWTQLENMQTAAANESLTLSRCFLGRLRFGSQISAAREKYSRLKAIMVTAQEIEGFSSWSRLGSGACIGKSLEYFIGNLDRDAQAKLSSLVKDQGDLVKEKAAALVAELFQGQLGAVLCRHYLNRCVLEPLGRRAVASENVGRDFAVSDRRAWRSSPVVARCVELARLAFREDKIIGPPRLWDAAPASAQLWDDFCALPASVADIIQWDLQRGAARQAKKILELVMSATLMQAALSNRPDIRRELFTSELAGDFRLDLFKIISNTPEIRKIIGGSRWDNFTREFAAALLEKLLVSPEHEDDTIRMGHLLFRLGHAELAPHLILNAYREPGHSGEYPFLGYGLGRNTILAEYLGSLSAPDLVMLDSRQIPGLSRIIQLIRRHPRTFNHRRLPAKAQQQHSWECNNPVYREIEQCLNEMVRHYLRQGSGAEKLFVLGLIDRNHNPLPTETLAAIEELLQNSPAAELRREIGRRIIRRISFYSTGYDAALAELLVHHLALELACGKSPATEESVTAGGRLFPAFFRVALTPRLLGDLSAISGLAGAELQAAHRLAGVLDASYRADLHHFYDTLNTKPNEALLALVATAQVPGIAEALLALQPFGYQYRAEHRRLMPELAQRHREIIGIIAELRKIQPHYRYHVGYAGSDYHFDQVFHPLQELLAAPSNGLLQQFLNEVAAKQGGRIPSSYIKALGRCLMNRNPESKRELPDSQWQWLNTAADLLLRQPNLNQDQFVDILRGLTTLCRAEGATLSPAATVAQLSAFRCRSAAATALQEGLELWLPQLKDQDSLVTLISGMQRLLSQGIEDEGGWRTIRGFLRLIRSSDHSALQPIQEIGLIEQYMEVFSTRFLPETFKTWLVLSANREPAPELAALGISATGRAGRAQLQQRFAEFRGRLLASQGTFALGSPLEAEWLRVTCRVGEAQFGRSADASVIVARFNKGIQDGRISALAAGYDLQQFQVLKLNAEQIRKFKFAEPCQRRYEQLQKEIRELRGLSPAELLRRATAELRSNLESELARLERSLTPEQQVADAGDRRRQGREQEARRIRDFMETRLAEQKTVAADSAIAEIDQLIQAVAEFERKDAAATTPVLRRLALFRALGELHNSGGYDQLGERPLSKETAALAVELIDDILKDQVLRRASFSPVAARRIMQACSVAALNDDLRRLEHVKTAGTEHWAMMPTRGVLAEFSGFIGDACWTSVAEITAAHPNLIAGIFVRNPGKLSERLGGATLFLKGRTLAGESALIVRGFNPLQNNITQLQAGDFFERVLDLAEALARQEGATLILVPGGGCGGSQTNRPSIALYLRDKYSQAPIIKLAPEPNTTFNGHSITEGCHLVRRLGGVAFSTC